MKTYLRVLLALALTGAVVTPAAGAKSTAARTETQAYEVGGQPSASTLGPAFAKVTFQAGPERFAEFEVADAAGQPVLAEVVQDNRVDTFCSSTKEAIPIKPGFPVEVRLFEGRCLDGSPSVVTQGEVTARFLPVAPRVSSALERPYSVSAPGPYVGIDPPVPGNLIVANVIFPSQKLGRASLEIKDVTGGAVASVVYQGNKEVGRFCGKTSGPLKVRPGIPLELYIMTGVCTDGTQSAPTNGVVSAVFSKGK